MANLVQIQINGSDNSAPAFAKAAGNARVLRSEMHGLGATFSQVGNVAALFGNTQLAGAISQLENSIVTSRMMTRELGHTKLAFAAMAAAATLGGYAVGGWVRQWVPWFNEVDKLEAGTKAAKELFAAANASTALHDPAAAAKNASIFGIDEKIQDIKSRSVSFAGVNIRDQTKEELDTIFQLEKLKADTEDKFREDKKKKEDVAAHKILDMQSALQVENAAFFEETTGKQLEVYRWYGDQKLLLDEDEKTRHVKDGQAREDLERALTLRLSRIWQDYQQRKLDQEKAARIASVQTFEIVAQGTANLLGALAEYSAQHGKKSFKQTQTLRIGEAIMSTAAAIARAYAEYGWPYCLIPAAFVGAAGAVQIATIASAKAPQAHGGLEYVPQESTYLLSKGERVIQPRQNEQLQDMLDRGGVGGGQGMTMVTINLDGRPLLKYFGQASADGRLTINARAII